MWLLANAGTEGALAAAGAAQYNKMGFTEQVIAGHSAGHSTGYRSQV